MAGARKSSDYVLTVGACSEGRGPRGGSGQLGDWWACSTAKVTSMTQRIMRAAGGVRGRPAPLEGWPAVALCSVA